MKKIFRKGICVLSALCLTACGTLRTSNTELPSVRFEYGELTSESQTMEDTMEDSTSEQNTIVSEYETNEMESSTMEIETITEMVTTEESTTEEITTEEITTEEPTTTVPETEAQTTEEITTEAPTTVPEVPSWVCELTLEQIKAINEASFNNPETGLVKLETITYLTGDQVRAYIEAYSIPNAAYYNNVPVTEEQKANLLASRNLEAIGSHISLQYGIMTENTAVRSFPTADKMTTSTDANAFDYIQETMFKVGEGVVIVHQTADQSYSFVIGEDYKGWVKTNRIGITSYPEFVDWMSCLDNTPMTVITRCAVIHGRYLRMGTKLPLISSANGMFTVKFPTTNNGTLEVVMIQVPDDGKCIAGYLPFTRINVIDQGDMLLEMPYAWGDTGANMDCSSTMNAIFATFGIILPRNSSDMPYTGTKVTNVSGMSAIEKEAFIGNAKPGTMLVMPGHVMMYVGEVGEVMTIFHNVTTYSLDGSNLIHAYQGVRTPLQIYTTSGASYLDRITYVIEW